MIYPQWRPHLHCIGFVDDWLIFARFPLQWPRDLNKIFLVLLVYDEPARHILDMAVRLGKCPLVFHCVLQNVGELEREYYVAAILLRTSYLEERIPMLYEAKPRDAPVLANPARLAEWCYLGTV